MEEEEDFEEKAVESDPTSRYVRVGEILFEIYQCVIYFFLKCLV